VSFIKRNSLFLGLVFTLLMGLTNTGYGQLCTGSLGDPVVKIDFGRGASTHGPALPAGTTNYTYSSADFPQDGSYTIENSTAGSGNVWWSTTDHTGDAGGYMMVVNASTSKTDYFYKTTVTGLCPGTTFEFASWITNLLRTNDISPPNITFTIRTTGANPTVLATYNTGSIPVTPSGRVWNQYGTFFTTPAGVTEVELQMTNNSNGGAPANDLALDDITFRPCGPTISSTITTNGNTAINQSACIGSAAQNYTLSSSVVAGSYVNPVYQWQSNNGSGWVNINGANATTYTFAFQPTTAGTYQYRMVTAEAANGVNSACQVSSNSLAINVAAPPTVNFAAGDDGTSCLRNIYKFVSSVAPGTGSIVSWKWEFGDGSTSDQADPTYTYTTFNTFDVKLTVVNSSGCSATITKQLTVTPKLQAKFDAVVQSCPNVPITFVDQSAVAVNSAIKEWKWNYGDNTTATFTDNAPRTHTYTVPNTYHVSLQITSTSNCVSDVFYKDITILPAPTPDFLLPDACVTDAVQFTDATTIAGGGNLPVNYLWDFGDATNSTLANPNTSIAKNPTHKFSQAGVYTIRLTVDGQNGCGAGTITKQFTVNSALPTARFTVQNSAALCSSVPVTIVNTSFVSFGNITKLEVYDNYLDSPTVKREFYYSRGEIPANGILPVHSYGQFNAPLSKQYTIRMIAYSGISCISTPVDVPITVYATPVVTLSNIDPICQDAGPVQVIEDKGIFAGTGVFTGTGISSTGLFNPAVAGMGTFPIHYVFTSATSGCTYITDFDITVTAKPAINMIRTAGILEGETTTLNPTVTGTGDLKFLWAPATGVSDATVRNPIFSPTGNTMYTLTVTADGGCSASASATISVLKTPVIPNAFTPNSDGINDTWEIKYLDTYPAATVEVFNRYGARVFTSNGYPKPWDGTFKGSTLPVGVYYYVINPKSGRLAMAGSLTIIK
jgi:gliding motility-associated-like protein